MITVALFFIGLFIGSFLLVVIDRFPRGESFVVGRSHCDMCQHVLVWYDLIPLISYLYLKGKCRYCHKPFGFQYPFVEITTGLVFGTIPIYFHLGSPVAYVAMGVILSASIVIFFCDMLSGLIPDIALLAILLGSLPFFVDKWENVLPHFIVGIGAALFFFLLFVGTKKRGMGLGDVKLAFVMGFLLGYPLIVLALYLAFLTGAGVALILIIAKRKKFRGSTISFGPFLILGMYACLLGGSNLWNFFLRALFKL